MTFRRKRYCVSRVYSQKWHT